MARDGTVGGGISSGGIGGGGGASGGTPALTLSTANTAGTANDFIRTDDTILAFDATAPSTQDFSDAAAAGTAAVAARRDHKHAMPASPAVPSAANPTGTVAGAAVNGSATTFMRSDAVPALSATVNPVGLQTCWIPKGAMVARTTNGAASGIVEAATNKNMLGTWDFDAATAEYVQFAIQMPKSWNEGTVTFAPVWRHAATTTNFGVAWFLQGVAISNDDASDVAFGTAQGSVATGGTTDDIYVGPTSSAITIAGTPAANDYVMFQVYRDVADGGDTMAIDARLHGIQLYYTTDAATDA